MNEKHLLNDISNKIQLLKDDIEGKYIEYHYIDTEWVGIYEFDYGIGKPSFYLSQGIVSYNMVEDKILQLYDDVSMLYYLVYPHISEPYHQILMDRIRNGGRQEVTLKSKKRELLFELQKQGISVLMSSKKTDKSVYEICDSLTHLFSR